VRQSLATPSTLRVPRSVVVVNHLHVLARLIGFQLHKTRKFCTLMQPLICPNPNVTRLTRRGLITLIPSIQAVDELRGQGK